MNAEERGRKLCALQKRNVGYGTCALSVEGQCVNLFYFAKVYTDGRCGGEVVTASTAIRCSYLFVVPEAPNAWHASLQNRKVRLARSSTLVPNESSPRSYFAQFNFRPSLC